VKFFWSLQISPDISRSSVSQAEEMPQLEPAVISDEAVDEYSTQAARGHAVSGR